MISTKIATVNTSSSTDDGDSGATSVNVFTTAITEIPKERTLRNWKASLIKTENAYERHERTMFRGTDKHGTNKHPIARTTMAIL